VGLRRLALAAVIADVGIVVTGGAVRLTGSGLGCPTWPRCDGRSYVTTAAMGYHSAIEFTNRTLTGVVGGLAALCVVAAWWQRRRGRLDRAAQKLDRAAQKYAAPRGSALWWAIAALAGVPAQAVLGGLTVLTKLNPWLVACHFLLSIAVIAAGYQFWRRTRAEHDTPAAGGRWRSLAWAILGVTAAVLAAGTVVTGSGPHAGDAHAKRTGLDPAAMAQLHADLVMLLIGLSVATWIALRVTGASPAARRAAAALVGVECAQGAVGFAQYFSGLPVLLVGVHMLGACLVWLAALGLLSALTGRPRNAAVAGPNVADQSDVKDRSALDIPGSGPTKIYSASPRPGPPARI
jgi:cytochrome c oxidase assembly protein subunit 15